MMLTSPLLPFSDNEESMDERDNVPDADTDLPDEDGDGEDLFDNNLLQDDHAANARLDTYSNADIDDEARG